jgi:hypothetical protein
MSWGESSAMAVKLSSRGMVMALRQGEVGNFPAYNQLLIQPMPKRRSWGTSEKVIVA